MAGNQAIEEGIMLQASAQCWDHAAVISQKAGREEEVLLGYRFSCHRQGCQETASSLNKWKEGLGRRDVPMAWQRVV
jgi:hypothetical protein